MKKYVPGDGEFEKILAQHSCKRYGNTAIKCT